MAKDRPNRNNYGSPQLEELEPRILFSADLLVLSSDTDANISPPVGRHVVEDSETENASSTSIEEIPKHIDDTQLIIYQRGSRDNAFLILF